MKGRVQSSTLEKEDGEKQFRIDVIAERVTFLTSKKEKEQSGKEK